MWCRKCHACHAACASMSPSATPGTQTAAVPERPPLRRRMHVDVAQCHAFHAKWRSMSPSSRLPRKQLPRPKYPSAPPVPVQCHKCHACHAKWRSMSPSATPATQNAHRCGQVPGLPQSMSPSATPGMQTAAAPKVPKRATTPSPVTEVPRLPRRMHVDVAKCHACHAKWRSMSPSATPATQTAAATKVPKGATRASPVP